MYSLVLLSALAIGLLLLFKVREGLDTESLSLETIKLLNEAPRDKFNEELDFRWSLLDEETKNGVLRMLTLGPRGSTGSPEENLQNAKYTVASAQDNFYYNVYADNPSVTEADIATYVEKQFEDAPPEFSDLKQTYKNIATTYFLRPNVKSTVTESLPLETIKLFSEIRSQPRKDKDLEYRWGLLDEETKNALMKDNPNQAMASMEIAGIQDQFYNSVYTNKSPVTAEDIDKYIEIETYYLPEKKELYKKVLKSYFLKGTSTTPSPTSTSASSYASTPVTSTSSSQINNLNAQYNSKLKQYNDLIDETVRTPESLSTNLEKIKTLNLEMSALLDQMITLITQNESKKDVSTLQNRLVHKLQKIQRDYDGLLVNTDKLETLRRIRQNEQKDWRNTIMIYLIIFSVMTVVMILLMIFRRQKSESTTSIPTMPTSITPLT